LAKALVDGQNAVLVARASDLGWAQYKSDPRPNTHRFGPSDRFALGRKGRPSFRYQLLRFANVGKDSLSARSSRTPCRQFMEAR
jgi:hypothetical protein